MYEAERANLAKINAWANESKIKAYREFMDNPDNIRNCDECPEKMERPSWEMPLPCGQQHCWVECHCRVSDDTE